MLVVGLTGGIGAGKTTVAAELAARGAAVIDVDRLGHVVLEPSGRAHAAVIGAFGRDIVGADGRIDRGALGRIVFADPAMLDRLTAISHPAINAELVDRLDAMDAAGEGIVVLDMAILAESNLGRPDPGHSYTVVVTVEAPVELRVQRAVARGMADADVRRRIAAQASEADRRALADHVVLNDGTAEHLARQVERVWRALTAGE
ncbi:MAG: dephospho-CoA kinase [Actinomycetota bacterium]|nr:dephospho-CoA kinase [Actinomycetota bacterium]